MHPKYTKLCPAATGATAEIGDKFDDKVIHEARVLNNVRNTLARLTGSAISRMAAAGAVTQLSGTQSEAFAVFQLLGVLPASGLDGVSSAADAGVSHVGPSSPLRQAV
jgi:hypothetical protein